MKHFAAHKKNHLKKLKGLILKCLVLLVLSPNGLFSQTTQGQDFWIAPLLNYQNNDSFFVIVSAEKPTTVEVDMPLKSFSRTISLGYNDLVRVFIPNNLKPGANDTLNSCGIHVTSDLPISVYTLSAQSATTDASCVFPSFIQPYGGQYMILTPRVYSSGYNLGNIAGFVCIDDSVEVEITPSVQTKSGYPASIPFIKKLYKGQCYLIESNSKVDLEGTIIKSKQYGRIAVFSGDICMAVRCAACDHVYEAIQPNNTLGKNFILSGFKDQSNGYDYQVVATEPGTVIKENQIPVKTLNTGEVYYRQVLGDSNICIESSKPVLLAQYMTGIVCQTPVGGDPAMLIINPLEQMIDYAVVSTANTTLVKTHFISIVTTKKGREAVFLDNAKIDTAKFSPTGCEDYYIYKDTTSPGNHKIECNEGFISYLYGIGRAESYAYSAGSGLRNLKRSIKSTSYPSCDSGFIVELESVGDSATSFIWRLNGQIDSAKKAFFTVPEAGTYSVTLLYKLVGSSTYDSTTQIVNVEEPEFDDFIPFDSAVVCASSFLIELPETKILKYTWQNGDTTSYFVAKSSGKYSVKIENTVTGCFLRDSCILDFHDTLKVRFGIDMDRACAGRPLFMNDSSQTSNDTIKSWQWVIDSKEFSAKQHDTLFNTVGNNYEIKLVVKTNKGCKDSLTKFKQVSSFAVAKFGVVKYDSCFGSNKFRFNNGSYSTAGKITEYKYFFGDGDSATTQQAFKTYKDSGTYTAYQVVKTEGGCPAKSPEIKITVYPAPVSTIDVVDSSMCFSQNYYDFRNASLGNGQTQKFIWQWGDGTGTTIENPGKTSFSDTGNFEVAFIAYYEQTGCKDTSKRTIKILMDPVSKIVLDSFNYCSNINYFTFRDTSIFDNTLPAESFWNWGDGSSSKGKSHIKSYDTTGNLIVEHIISLGKGCTDTSTKKIVIFKGPESKIFISDSNICSNSNYFSIADSSKAENRVRFFWDFGDGTDTTARLIPNKSYGKEGQYTITLELYDPLYNCRDTSKRLVTVKKSPILKIHANDTVLCSNTDTLFFEDSTDYGNLKASSEWKINSINYSSIKTKDQTALAQGTHTLVLYGGQKGVCYDSTQLKISVKHHRDSIAIKTTPIQKCVPASFNFGAKAPPGYNWSHNWNLSEAGNSSETSPKNISFPSLGVHYIVLNISETNCSFAKRDTIEVLPNPKIEIVSSSPLNQCLNGNEFNFSSIHGENTYTTNWYVNETQVDSNSLKPIRFTNYGPQNVKVTLLNANNCKDSSEILVNVYPNIAISLKPDTLCPGGVQILKPGLIPKVSNLTYNWYLNNQLVGKDSWFTYSHAQTGVEFVKLKVKTQNNCQDSIENVSLATYEKPVANFSFVENNPTSRGVLVNYTDLSTGATRLLWTLDAGHNSTDKNPNHWYTNLGTKKVQLLAFNDNNCSDTITQEIEITSSEIIFIPNAFSPNQNGRNETFKPSQISAINDYRMQVYNRWGQLIYSSTDAENGWDGTYMGEPVPEGVYVYYIYARFITGSITSKSGSIHLLR